jgi:membrane protease YdiL (CAAX protease family)
MSQISPDASGAGGGVAPVQPPGPAPAGYAPLESAGTAPFTKHTAWLWFIFALAGFLAGQIIALLFGNLAGQLAGKSTAQMKAISTASVPPEWYVVTTLFGLWIGFAGAPWLASRTQGTRHFLRDLGVRFRWVDLWGLGIGVAGQIGIALLYAPFRHEIHNFNAPSQKLTGGSHGGGFLIIALATVIGAPFMEELFFRGLLFKSLARLLTHRASPPRGFGVVLAVIVDGLLFGLAHGEWVQLAGLALFGAVLAAISFRTGRLGMNIVSHASFNLVAVLVIAGQRGGVIH